MKNKKSLISILFGIVILIGVVYFAAYREPAKPTLAGQPYNGTTNYTCLGFGGTYGNLLQTCYENLTMVAGTSTILAAIPDRFGQSVLVDDIQVGFMTGTSSSSYVLVVATTTTNDDLTEESSTPINLAKPGASSGGAIFNWLIATTSSATSTSWSAVTINNTGIPSTSPKGGEGTSNIKWPIQLNAGEQLVFRLYALGNVVGNGINCNGSAGTGACTPATSTSRGFNLRAVIHYHD